MKVLLTAATEGELHRIRQYLSRHWLLLPSGGYSRPGSTLEVDMATLGPGILPATYHLLKLTHTYQPDWILLCGIAGCFSASTPQGTTFLVASEQLADWGIDDRSTFRDVFEVNLVPAATPPFSNGSLPNPWLSQLNLPYATAPAVTVQTTSGSQPRIDTIAAKYQPQIESMEGAALHYVGLMENIPFLQIRTISNLVEPRNRDNWNIPLALDNLASATIDILEQLPLLS
jgi:futalosine hydrolase